jgi:hypothetical protein
LGDLRDHYETIAEPANGYLTQLQDACVLVDAVASETADWARQTHLATLLSLDNTVALSVFIIGDLWAIALSYDGKAGPVAAFTPDNSKAIDQLPHVLFALEKQLVDLFPDRVDAEAIDQIFGAMLEGAVSAEDGIVELLDMLGCPPDWLRWSWYETIPEQLFLDPDLTDRVAPLGEARTLWEE